MIIRNLDIDRPGRPSWPLETNPPLIIDPDAVLNSSITRESFQPIASQRCEIFEIWSPLGVDPAVSLPVASVMKAKDHFLTG
jgi:hypothetical protein